ncbi:hypothetical protein GIB67_024860 [Kingdonia uniflora]|uniref:Uncharacterized protein n=1 Tax=Kingdonia uniflora TaxID=39325 RepID=A0A7J7NZ81_9MAGN|nr:hypothetical protein GIB67_024860 [Kingdonia uniflora]
MEENGLRVETSTQEAIASTSHTVENLPVTETDKTSGNIDDNKQESEKIKAEENLNTVPLYKLFSFADSKDVMLMVLWAIGALANGLTTPFMTILLADVIHSLGENAGTKEFVPEVSKVALNFVYLAVVARVA